MKVFYNVRFRQKTLLVWGKSKYTTKFLARENVKIFNQTPDYFRTGALVFLTKCLGFHFWNEMLFFLAIKAKALFAAIGG